MSWTDLQCRAEELGLELAFRIRTDDADGPLPDFAGPGDPEWMLVGNYDHAAGIWVRPRNDVARGLSAQNIAATMACCDRFFEPVADYDADFFAAAAPFRLATQNPDRGRMLA